MIKHLPQGRCFFVAQIQSKNTPRLKPRTTMRYFNVADNSKILLRNKCSFLRFYPFIQLEGYENMKTNDQNAFIRMPKSLIYGDKYRFLSVHAKLLYALMADRASLSLSTNGEIVTDGCSSTSPYGRYVKRCCAPMTRRAEC